MERVVSHKAHKGHKGHKKYQSYFALVEISVGGFLAMISEPGDCRTEIVGVYGLGEKRLKACSQSAFALFIESIPGQRQRRGLTAAFERAHLRNQTVTIFFRHPQVADHNIRLPILNQLDRLADG